MTSGLNSLNYENSLLLSIGKFKLDSIDRYENSCHNHLDVSFGKNGSRVKMIDTLTENIFHHLIKSARVSYFLIFLCYDSLSDTAKRWLEYEWILPDAQQRVLKLLIEWTADKDLFPIESLTAFCTCSKRQRYSVLFIWTANVTNYTSLKEIRTHPSLPYIFRVILSLAWIITKSTLALS